jgi:hypothetical protein
VEMTVRDAEKMWTDLEHRLDWKLPECANGYRVRNSPSGIVFTGWKGGFPNFSLQTLGDDVIVDVRESDIAFVGQWLFHDRYTGKHIYVNCPGFEHGYYDPYSCFDIGTDRIPQESTAAEREKIAMLGLGLLMALIACHRFKAETSDGKMTPQTYPWSQWKGKENKVGLYHLALGVLGRAFHEGDDVYIQWIQAEVEGSGDVGRFLNRLSPNCQIIDVVSPRLEGMLTRRGWKMIGTKTDSEHVETSYWKRVENVHETDAKAAEGQLDRVQDGRGAGEPG